MIYHPNFLSINLKFRFNLGCRHLRKFREAKSRNMPEKILYTQFGEDIHGHISPFIIQKKHLNTLQFIVFNNFCLTLIYLCTRGSSIHCLLTKFTIQNYISFWPRRLACAMRSLAFVITIVRSFLFLRLITIVRSFLFLLLLLLTRFQESPVRQNFGISRRYMQKN